MGRETLHEKVLRSYLKHMTLRDAAINPIELDIAEACTQLHNDIAFFQKVRDTRYLNPRMPIPKDGNLHLAWEYAKDPALHPLFKQMLRVSPLVFGVILELIKRHPVFSNNSNVPQTPVDYQLAVTLFCMGRFGNAASLIDVAREAGCSTGAVEEFSDRCFTAIESLHDTFVWPLTPEEKEAEKQWMDKHMGFVGTWREGWVMYDGTIVVLYARPGLDGDAYYTRKSNYGLNLQIGNVASTLRIVNYSHGYTGSAHDATAFEHTAARKHPEWFFEGNEFAWADSAYPLNKHTIPVHRKPASLRRENTIFDKAVAHLRVRSEHCMGALKGRFQSLRGLRVSINSREDHLRACRWITVAIILHNLIIDVEGQSAGDYFRPIHTHVEEEEDTGVHGEDEEDEDGDEDEGEVKRCQLTAELLAYREQQGIRF